MASVTSRRVNSLMRRLCERKSSKICSSTWHDRRTTPPTWLAHVALIHPAQIGLRTPAGTLRRCRGEKQTMHAACFTLYAHGRACCKLLSALTLVPARPATTSFLSSASRGLALLSKSLLSCACVGMVASILRCHMFPASRACKPNDQPPTAGWWVDGRRPGGSS